MPQERGHLRKIRVQRYDRVAVNGGIPPKRPVVGLFQPEMADVTGCWEEVGKLLAESEAQILIEQQLHVVVRVRRSRSAA